MTKEQMGTTLRGCLPGGRSQKAEQLYLGFTSQNFGLCHAQVEKAQEEIKKWWVSKTCNLGPSAVFMALISTFQHDYHNNQLAVWWPSLLRLATQRPTAIFDCCQYQDLPSKGSSPDARIFLVLVVVLVLNSERKNLVLGRSQHQQQVQPFACKSNSENIYGTRMIHLLGLSQ